MPKKRDNCAGGLSSGLSFFDVVVVVVTVVLSCWDGAVVMRVDGKVLARKLMKEWIESIESTNDTPGCRISSGGGSDDN
jgi:hypothetical protein